MNNWERWGSLVVICSSTLLVLVQSERKMIFAMRKSVQVLLLVSLVALAALKVQADGANEVIRIDPALDDIVPADAKVEKVASGFGHGEGTVWVRQGKGYLLFSDIPANVIYKWTPDRKVSVFLKPSGFTGTDPAGIGGQSGVGSNGVTLDPQGRVVFCAHGDRDVTRLEKNGQRTVLADRYEGKRLNSPNDLVFKSDGSLYFTDPPAGLRKQGNDYPLKELPFNGVYLVKSGKVQLLIKDMPLPNGLAFTPDEKYFYVNDSIKKVIMRYEVQPDDTIANGQVFIDMTPDTAPGGPDGMKVDHKGNVYCTGPGGFWIMSPDGRHLGTVRLPELVKNLAFGDSDGKTLYLISQTALYRIRLKIPGIRP
jgi:gluconolactonase